MPSCSVPYCATSSTKDVSVTFHEFPLKTPLFLNTWLQKIGRPNWRPGLRSVVCSKHFVKGDFDRNGKLRMGSFPSMFPEPPTRKKKRKVESSETSGTVTPLQNVVFCRDSISSSLQLQKSGNDIPFSGCKPLKIEEKQYHEPEVLVKVEELEQRSNMSIDHQTESPGIPLKEAALSSTIMTNELIPLADRTIDETSSSTAMKRKRPEDIPVINLDYTPISRVNSNDFPVSNVNVSFSCRVCGYTNTLNPHIFGREGLKDDLAGLINSYLPIKVAETDSLPLHVCDSCISRLKAWKEIMANCSRNNKLLHGKSPNQSHVNMNSNTSASVHPKAVKQSRDHSQHDHLISKQQKNIDSGEETLIIHQQTVVNKSSLNGVSRILLLEMPCQEQVPVKAMITQAIEELKIRLQPKEVRKSKPHGRIMFLDLQGGRAAYPEQMSKAVAMMFGNISSETSKKKGVLPATTLPIKPSVVQGSSPSLVKIAPSNKSAQQGNPVVAPLPMKVPTAIQIAPLSSASVPTPITCSTLPLTMPSILPPPNVKTVLALPPGQNFPNLIQLPPDSVPFHLQTHISNNIESIPPSFPQLVPVSVGSTKNTDAASIPPMVAISGKENKDLKTITPPLKLPVEIARMREKVLTKINNKGKQFKLGDKIVGIVLRNSDSSEEIQKKLQATFSKSTVTSKPVTKPKERPIAPKGSSEINSSPFIETTVVTDFIENVKKPKEPVIDISSAPDKLCSYFERRHSPKPTLSFMWRKTAYLASSYQKLFTWVPPFGPGTMPVLSCRVCCRTVSNKSEVEAHLQSHPDLQCVICQKYFLTVDKVHEHVKVIHHISPYDMPKKKTFIIWRHNALRKQLLKQFQCSRCERRYKQKEALERHSVVCKQRTLSEKVVAISNANLISCPVCNKNMLTNTALQEHMLVHTKRTSWLCDICGQVLKSQSNYRSHTARHEELAHQFKYQCKVCKKRFKLVNRYMEHEKSHEVERQFICPSCGKVFRTLNGLRQHEILHGERKLQCRFCPSRFHRRDHLRIHEACHNKPANKSRMPRNFRCRFCPVSEDSGRFPNMKQLMDHYAQEHELERGKIPGSHKYSCDRCPRTFINSTLLRHHYMWHDGERPYHCSTCGQGFMIKERLRNHENIHTNERPHKCQQCGKGFRSRHVLKQHKKVHSDPSTHFRCKFCQKGFSRIDNLRTHELVHTGVKPWRCAICLRQFRIRADCAKHITVTHELSPADVQLNIENALETQTSNRELVEEGSVKAITSVNTIEFLLEEDELEEEEEAIECD